MTPARANEQAARAVRRVVEALNTAAAELDFVRESCALDWSADEHREAVTFAIELRRRASRLRKPATARARGK